MSTICCCCSISKSCLNICDLTTAARQASPSFTISWSFFRFNPLNRWCYLTTHPLFPLSLLPSIFPSIRVFSNELALPIRWPKYWSFSFSISPSNEYSELISFRIDSFDLLAVQRSLKSPLQHYNLKASILQPSGFFMDQLSHPYITTGKTTVLTIRSFVGKAISLLFNTLYSTYKLKKQGDNRQPGCTPFSICNQSVVPCSLLIVASWSA